MILAGPGVRPRQRPEAHPPGDPLDPGRFFRRKRTGFPARPARFLTAEAPNLDEFLFLPVATGLWRQHELWDGTYTLDDLLDAVELIRTRRENEIRAAEASAPP